MSRDQLQGMLSSTRKEVDKVKDQLIEILMTPQHDPRKAQQLTAKKYVLLFMRFGANMLLRAELTKKIEDIETSLNSGPAFKTPTKFPTSVSTPNFNPNTSSAIHTVMNTPTPSVGNPMLRNSGTYPASTPQSTPTTLPRLNLSLQIQNDQPPTTPRTPAPQLSNGAMVPPVAKPKSGKYSCGVNTSTNSI